MTTLHHKLRVNKKTDLSHPRLMALAIRIAKKGDWDLANRIELEYIRRNVSPYCAALKYGEDGHAAGKFRLQSHRRGALARKITQVTWLIPNDCTECDGVGEITYSGRLKDYEFECPACDGTGDADYEEQAIPITTTLTGEVHAACLSSYFKEIGTPCPHYLTLEEAA